VERECGQLPGSREKHGGDASPQPVVIRGEDTPWIFRLAIGMVVGRLFLVLVWGAWRMGRSQAGVVTGG